MMSVRDSGAAMWEAAFFLAGSTGVGRLQSTRADSGPQLPVVELAQLPQFWLERSLVEVISLAQLRSV